MYEDGFITYEITEEEFELICNSFANEACAWVTYEVRKALGDGIKQHGTYPGCTFHILHPKTLSFPTRVILSPISENELSVWCLHTKEQNKILSLEDAVDYILNI